MSSTSYRFLAKGLKRGINLQTIMVLDEQVFQEAERLIYGWKGDGYVSGQGVLDQVGPMAARHKRGSGKVLVVASGSSRNNGIVDLIFNSLTLSQVGTYSEFIGGSTPNTPIEGVEKMAQAIKDYAPSLIVVVGSGSTIDAAKAANAMHHLGGLEPLYGAGKVSGALNQKKLSLIPLIAVQTAASSAAHLTKYGDVTEGSQKRLLIDPAIVPSGAVFDYRVTTTMPQVLTADGGLDGIAHMWEVFMGATGKGFYNNAEKIVKTGVPLILDYILEAYKNPSDLTARRALALGTDLGGYAIMLEGGGTNFPHLFSFSMVDLPVSHGRAVAVNLPYATLFFSPAIQPQLRAVAEIMGSVGLVRDGGSELYGRDLGMAVAEGFMELYEQLGVPTNLNALGFTDGHVKRIMKVAYDSAEGGPLISKFEQAPIPLIVKDANGKPDVKASRQMMDDTLRPLIKAARTGKLSDVPKLLYEP